MSHHIVEVRDLEYVYPDGTKALRGVGFTLTHGESVALVGANGAGKSTLLLHLNGFLSPMKGAVAIGHVDITPKNLTEVRKAVGMVFQDPDDQLFMPTVGEDVAFGPLNLGLPSDEVEKRVGDALSRVGAEALRDRPPHRLSGGEKRSVAIASVLSMQPDILVMDEPSSNLDPAARRRLINLLSGFSHTKIIATHDLDMVMDLCERTIIMQRGEVLADGLTVDIFQDEDLLSRAGLEKPSRMQPCAACGAVAELPHHSSKKQVKPHSHDRTDTHPHEAGA